MEGGSVEVDVDVAVDRERLFSDAFSVDGLGTSGKYVVEESATEILSDGAGEGTDCGVSMVG
jgi:hypothetical protein